MSAISSSSPSSDENSQSFSTSPSLSWTPLLALLASCFLSALLLIQWEDYHAHYLSPSRLSHPATQLPEQRWGAYATHGLASTQSYNDVLKEHFAKTVPEWRHPTWTSVQGAHGLCDCLRDMPKLQQLAQDYQWDTLRAAFRSEPWVSLGTSMNAVRSSIDSQSDAMVVGMDWASCAWRSKQCGAWADAVEAIDEIDSLLGILEPYEVLFCLDIVERSLRDVLAVAQLEPADALWYQQELPAYRPHRVFDAFEPLLPGMMEEDYEGDLRIDDSYFQALQELRID